MITDRQINILMMVNKQILYSPHWDILFGEVTNSAAEKYDFFTGKPYIGELGYSFLFRNYRADHNRWQSADPSGYPDGWNNLAYVNNNVLNAVDPLGLCEEVDGKVEGCSYGFGVIRDGRGSSNTYYRTVTCGSGGLIVNVGVDGITGSTYLNGFDCGQFYSLRVGSITYRIVATSYSPYTDWHCHKTGFSKVYRGTPYLSFEIDYEYSIECD